MPIYEFKCNCCGSKFEQIIFASDKGAVPCPSCGKEDTCRLLSSFSCGASSSGGSLGISSTSSGHSHGSG